MLATILLVSKLAEVRASVGHARPIDHAFSRTVSLLDRRACFHPDLLVPRVQGARAVVTCAKRIVPVGHIQLHVSFFVTLVSKASSPFRTEPLSQLIVLRSRRTEGGAQGG